MLANTVVLAQNPVLAELATEVTKLINQAIAELQ